MSRHNWYIPLTIAAVLSAVVLGVAIWILKQPPVNNQSQGISEQDIAEVKEQMEQSKNDLFAE